MTLKKLIKSIAKNSYLFAILLYAPTTMAHDFWLAPNSYHVEDSGLINVSVMIGHPKDKLSWPVNPHRVIALRSLNANNVNDHQASIKNYSALKNLPIRLNEPGLHILTIETTHAFSELKANDFNNYIEEEGLTSIQTDRVARKRSRKSGKEIYSRRGKSLIQVGNPEAIDLRHIDKPLGLTLEIVPLNYPKILKANEEIKAEIYYRGALLRGATVKLVSLNTNNEMTTSKLTDSNGQVSFKRPEKGQWMLHTIWSDPLEDTSEADYDTIFSSLSFEVD